MKIITLTLNPAFDIHCDADGFLPYKESILKITSREAGGKGVNISRALSSVGTKSTALIVVGRENGDEFCRSLDNDGLAVLPIYREGRIRENITLHEKENPETRISFGGFSVDREVLDEVADYIGGCDGETVVTLTGSIPSGIAAKDVLDRLCALKVAGARVVIDSRSVSLDEITAFKPWLIKPNKDEAEKYSGTKIETPSDAAEIAKRLCSLGIENVVISLGGDGAVLATSGDCFFAKAPQVSVLSTVGAGDSMIAGFIDAFTGGKAPTECLRRAVAFGTAACMCEGTSPPKEFDINLIEKNIKITQV